jgi:hypothetical protein
LASNPPAQASSLAPCFRSLFPHSSPLPQLPIHELRRRTDQLSQHDIQALKEIIEQYKDGNCDRNTVIVALLIGIASICVVEKRAPHIDLVLPHLDQLDAYDRDEASDDGSYKTAE